MMNRKQLTYNEFHLENNKERSEVNEHPLARRHLPSSAPIQRPVDLIRVTSNQRQVGPRGLVRL